MNPQMYRWASAVGPLVCLIGCQPDPKPPTDETGADTDTGAALECPEGELPDGERCVPERCGQGTWGAVEGGQWFVAAGAASGGEGSAEAPFATIGEALAAGATGRIVLAEGVYEERVSLGEAQDGVELLGRCPDLVSWTAPRADPDAILAVDAPADATFTVASLRMFDHDVGVRHQGGTLRLAGVDVEDLVGPAIDVLGDDARLVLEDVGIRRVTAGRGDLVGFGLRLQFGAQAELHRVELSETTEEGIAVEADGVLTGEDVSVLDVSVGGDPEGSRALWVGQDATVTLTGLHTRGGEEGARVTGGSLTLGSSTFESHTDAAVLTSAGTLDFEQTDIVGPFAESSAAFGVAMDDASTLRWAGGTVSGTGVAALFVAGGSELEIEGLTVRDSSGEDEASGSGVLVEGGSSLSAHDLQVTAVMGVGVGFDGEEGGALSLTDCAVTDVARWSTGDGGLAVRTSGAQGGRLERVAIGGARGAGLRLSGGDVTLVDVHVTGSGPDAAVDEAGLYLTDGAQAWLEDVVVEQIAGPGWQVEAGSTVEATGGSTTATQRALLGFDSVVRWTGGVVRDSHGSGLYMEGLGGLLELTDVQVSDTALLGDGSGGFGVAVSLGAEAQLEDLDVSGSTGRGVVLDGALVRLDGVRVSDTGPWDGQWSYGLGLREGTSGTVSGLVVDGATGAGVYVSAAGTADAPLQLDDVEVTGIEGTADGAPGVGLSVREGGQVELVLGRFEGVEGPGILVRDSHLGCTGCTTGDTAAVGVALFDGDLRLTEGAVDRVAPISDTRGGVGVYVGAASDGEEVALELVDTEVRGADAAALYLGGPGAYRVSGGALVAGAGDDGAWPSGHALVLVAEPTLGDGTRGLWLEGVELGTSSTTTALLHGSTARFAGDTWAEADLQLVQQSCAADLPAPVGLDEDGVTHTELCTGEDHWFVPLDLDYDPLP